MRLTALLIIVVIALPVHAVGQAAAAPDLLVTHVAQDALSGSVVNKIVQTRDGFLWMMVGFSGLFRFDGRTAHEFDGVGRVRSIAPAPNGDLWFATIEGLTRIPAARLSLGELKGLTFHPPNAADRQHRISKLHVDRAGTLWVGTNRGLYRYEQGRYVPASVRGEVREVQETPAGRLFVTSSEGLFEIVGDDIRENTHAATRLGVKKGEVFHAVIDRRGRTWYATGSGVARETDGRVEWMGPRIAQTLAPIIYEDARGTVWIGKDGALFRYIGDRLELAVPGVHVRVITSDRDGSVWFGTNGDALYRVRTRPLRVFTTADGLPSDVIMTVLTARDGTVWAGGNCGGIARFDGSRFQTLNEAHGLLNSCVLTMREASDGALWIGTYGGGAFRYADGTFIQYSKPHGLPGDVVFSIAVARDKAIWFGTNAGVARLRDGRVRTFTTADGLPASTFGRLIEDGAGVLWVGSLNGVYRHVNERFEPVPGVPVTRSVRPIDVDADGGMFLAVDYEQVLRVHHGRTETISGPPGTVVEMVTTGDGQMWLAGSELRRVRPRDLSQPRAPDEPLDFEPVSLPDGISTPMSGGGTRALSLSDGDQTLWAATTKGLAMLDLRRWPVTETKPLIYLTTVTIGRQTKPAEPHVVLPPGTSHLAVAFSALELVSPEKLRFQYRLEGVDSEWLDAPADLRAVYSQIPVGTRALRIRSSNRHGIWDRQGVTFLITHQPFFYQTRWFAALVALTSVLLMFGIYRLRVRHISRNLSMRFDERLAERTRVARDLHDTLLQTVQGSKMVADHALKDPSDHDRVVASLKQLAGWLAQATEEGRAALQSLRASAIETNDLAAALRRAIDECRADSTAEVTFSAVGRARDLHPVVRDEIYRIGYEAVRNACVHSRATSIAVTLTYDADVTLAIADDGVGIDATVIVSGKEGHFGLRGMRERAERVGARLTIVSRPETGTALTLVVPGRTAYRFA